MKRALPVGLCGLLAALSASAGTPVQDATEYRPVFGICGPPQCEPSLIVLRDFMQGGRRFVLAVGAEDLTTRILPSEGLAFERLSWEQVRESTRATPYGQAISDAERSADAEQDAGIVHTLPRGNGVVLSIDLCPSTNPLDRRLFEALARDFPAEEKPIPVAIAVAGAWMLAHAKDLAWLQKLERDGEIAVTWINHSFHHRYDRGAPLSRNFLRESGTDFAVEVLATEQAMIARGLRPSAFFRFPGLVSDPRLVRRVLEYGLIPVGSDAWLAKDQVPSSGSIVLVHGNGNEPLGIQKFFALVKKQHNAGRNWLLSDLGDSVSRAERARAWTVARTEPSVRLSSGRPALPKRAGTVR